MRQERRNATQGRRHRRAHQQHRDRRCTGQKPGNVNYESWAHVFDVNTMGPPRVLESFTDHIAGSERRLVVTITSGMGSLAENTSGSSIAYRLQGGREYRDAKRCDRFGARGKDRYGRSQGAVVATGERDGHAAAHRYVRPKSIGQVLQLRRSRISVVKGARRSRNPQEWIQAGLRVGGPASDAATNRKTAQCCL
jgi:hypothetical protein